MNGRIAKFGWRNIWRNKRRTYFTLISIIFGVTAIIFLRAYFEGFRRTSAEELIKTQTGHIKIAHREFLRLERIMPREYLVNETDLAHVHSVIHGIPGVGSVCERIKFHALLNRGEENKTAVVIGMDPGKADESMGLSRAIIQGNYYTGAAPGQPLTLIIGKSLARDLNAAVGDELLLVTSDINYSTYALPFKIAGIFETGYSSMDKHIVFIPLAKAREMLDCGESVNEMLIFLKDPDRAVEIGETMKQELAGSQNPLEVVPWQENDFVAGFMPFIDELIDKIVFIFMLMVALVILNTMLMAVIERYHEIGVIKALGLKNGEVRKMILIEALFMGIIGSAVGGLLGGTLSAILEKTGINVSEMLGEGVLEKFDLPVPLLGKVIHPDFNLSILVGSLVFGILMAVIAALYPAYKSAKMSPVEALRSQLRV
jgi:putative ABC transport system permease protein